MLNLCFKMYSSIATILTILTLVMAIGEVKPKRHICECFKSSAPLDGCIHMQGLTRLNDTLYLIESDNVYELPSSALLLVNHKPRLFFYSKYHNQLTQPTPWQRHRSFSAVKDYWNQELLHYAIYPNVDIERLNQKITIKHIDFSRGRIYIMNDHVTPFSTSENMTHNGIFSGYDVKGYFIIKNGSFIQFLDATAYFNDKQREEDFRFLKLNPANGNEAIFARREEKADWKAIPDGSRIPYGVQYFSETVILDFKVEKAYIFTTLPLYEYDQLNRPFPIRQISLRNFFRCSPPLGTTVAPLNHVKLLIIFIVIFSVIVIIIILAIVFHNKKLNKLKVGTVKSGKIRHYNYLTLNKAGRFNSKTKVRSPESRKKHRSNPKSGSLKARSPKSRDTKAISDTSEVSRKNSPTTSISPNCMNLNSQL